MNLLLGKRFLITGMINKYSIAYGIARAIYRQKAELAFTYQNEKAKQRIEKIVQKEFNSNLLLPCDVNNKQDIHDLFQKLKKSWKTFDGFLHSIAYANPKNLSGNYLDSLTQEDFMHAHKISTYSFSEMSKLSRSMINSGGSIVTITYIGSERIIPNYNIMGIAKAALEASVRYIAYSLGNENIRVNAISAAPIKTLSASGIKNFKKMLKNYGNINPLKKIINIHDIGNVATFLFSDLSSIVTGEIIHADGGFHIMSAIENEN
ncbi:NADH-dependent enoyl-[acyl-carrier-protein] reductase [Wigglesworthia glossinidia endosymbiont of Glossina morsitans morsitans (Yale colony)]|uniref:Enoyl-[acyl-carrier-protein] reductase [NADH] n=1 Tax=Wigglesworthia glossinidia endosymbiont of Glossina morsitans morsitans (Yale colony) TaxID=1142511 RepID=H6Q4V4_WIGGL|nr:enoyl-ACP reductase [Wigglesworthia glossinidia]AFA41237.1 NADH-dependent enoyl-[acyl-carrier-protein] reductase [Wigglesworthia glossinidia endosymbiont of Glossina morsitans morsitans (Yale colony)]